MLLNLIINAIEAMRDVGEEERELLISTVTNRMACQSRCEIQVQASRRRILTACSRLSTHETERCGAWAVDLPVDYRSA